jgi:hypothetical protein
LYAALPLALMKFADPLESTAREIQCHRFRKSCACMSKDEQRLIDYLAHMLQVIERITRYTDNLDEVVFLRKSWFRMP